MTTLPVNIRIGAIDRLSSVLNNVSQNLDGVRAAAKRTSDRFAILQANTEGFRNAMSKAGAGLKSVGTTMIAGVTAPIALAGVSLIKTAATFEKQMNKVRAVANPTEEGFKKLREQAKQLGADTKFSAMQAAEAMSFLGMAGFDTTKIMGAMPGVLDLAAASNMDLGRTADIVSATLNQFKLPATEAIKVADVLTRVTVGAAVDMEDLAEAMKYAGPVAKQFGMSLEDTAASAGLLGNLGIKGSQAGVSLKNMIMTFSAPTGATIKALKRLNLTVADSKGNLRGFASIMQDLGGKLGKLSQKDKMQALNDLFGQIAIAGGGALTDMAKAGELEKFIKTMGDVNITAKKVASIMNEGAAGAMDEFSSAVENLGITIGDSGVLQSFTDIVKGVTNWIRDLATASPATMRWAAGLALVAAALGPMILLLGQFAIAIPAIVTVFSGLLAVLGVGLGKFALIALGIGAVVAAGIFLYQNWDMVKEFLGRIWSAISIFLDSHLGKWMALLVPFIGVPALIFKYWEPIKGFFIEVLDAVSGAFARYMAFTEVSNKAVADFTAASVDSMIENFNKFKEIFSPLWNWIYEKFFSKFEGAMGRIKSGVETVKGLIPDLPEIPQGVKDFGNNFLPDVGAMGEALFGAKADPLGPVKPGPQMTSVNEQKNKLEVVFKNAPDGMKVQSDSKSNDFFNVRTGLQGALGL
jgi:TP901 family phage tail tape measure protein